MVERKINDRKKIKEKLKQGWVCPKCKGKLMVYVEATETMQVCDRCADAVYYNSAFKKSGLPDLNFGVTFSDFSLAYYSEKIYCDYAKGATNNGDIYIPPSYRNEYKEFAQANAEAKLRKSASPKGAKLTVAAGKKVNITNTSENKFSPATFAKQALNHARTFVLNSDEMLEKGVWLYIAGVTPGSGKTMLASIIANEIILDKPYVDVKFVPINVLFNKIYRAFTDKSSIDEVVEKYNRADLLIIDDFGSEKDGDFQSREIFNILDYRYSHSKATIFTSNHYLDEIVIEERSKNRMKAKCQPLYLINYGEHDSNRFKVEHSILKKYFT